MLMHAQNYIIIFYIEMVIFQKIQLYFHNLTQDEH